MYILGAEGLQLRPLEIGDLDTLCAYNSTPDFWEFLPCDPPTRTSTKAYILQQRERFFAATPQELTWGITLPPENTVIGTVTLRLGCSNRYIAELGYALDPLHHGQGYATRAAGAVLAFGFNTLQLHRIFAYADPNNHKSMAVMQRLGMVYEGTAREDVYARGQWRSSKIYAILAQEFAAATKCDTLQTP